MEWQNGVMSRERKQRLKTGTKVVVMRSGNPTIVGVVGTIQGYSAVYDRYEILCLFGRFQMGSILIVNSHCLRALDDLTEVERALLGVYEA
jgi:hypothetical protein